MAAFGDGDNYSTFACALTLLLSPAVTLVLFFAPSPRQTSTLNQQMSNKAGGGGGAAGGGSGGSSSSGTQGTGNNASSSSSAQDHTSIVLEYLVKRGYNGAAQALRAELDPSSVQHRGQASAAANGQGAGSSSSTSHQQGQSQPNAPRAVAGGRNISQDTFEKRHLGNANHQAAAVGAARPGANVHGASIGPNGKPVVREDPMPWRDGLFGLREFVHGSLDIHRPELLPILLPVYVHSIIDLIMLNFKDQAEVIFRSFVADYQSTNPSIVNLLSSLKSPSQIFENEQANRWRRERYVVKMTRRGWSLLLGWLQGGSQGLLGHTAQSGEHAERGREKMLGIINERVRVDVLDAKSAALLGSSSRINRFLDGGGLESELVTDGTGPTAASALPPPLKLGPMPVDPKLSREVQRTLQAQGLSSTTVDQSGTSSFAESTIPGTHGDSNGNDATPSALSGYAIPPVNVSDLPPYPPSFRTIDVKREVEKIKEARRRIRLGPVGSGGEAKHAPGALLNTTGQARYNLPSVCMFTMHDTNDS